MTCERRCHECEHCDEALAAEEAERHVRPDCPTCRGTGIGQFGDPDTSKCGQCRGRGWLSSEADKDELAAMADYEIDRAKDEPVATSWSAS